MMNVYMYEMYEMTKILHFLFYIILYYVDCICISGK